VRRATTTTTTTARRNPRQAPIVGIVLASAGGVLTAVGVGAGVFGALPAFAYLGGTRDQAAAVSTYERADSAAERREAAGDAADAFSRQTTNARSWNDSGRFIAAGGVLGALVGVGTLVGGIVAIATAGAPDEAGADDEDDIDRGQAARDRARRSFDKEDE
jgi:hypothetical protein